MKFHAIFDELATLANQEQALQMQAYMKNQFAFLGVPAPKRRAVQQAFFKADKSKKVDWEFVNECWACEYRELQYVACDYLKRQVKYLSDEHLPHLQDLIVQKSWWDTVDSLAPTIGRLVCMHPQMSHDMIMWSMSENVWLCRVAIIHQLLQKDNTNTKLLATIIKNNLGKDEFFINKAIGWALRDYAKTNGDWVRQFVGEHQSDMATLSIKEACKYIGRA